MPEGYTHIRTAQRAARAIHYKVKCPEAFAAGANGPDLLFGFEAWKPAAKRRSDLPALGRRMHEERTGAFLQSLLRHVHTLPQVEYALGFVAHYATDTVLHPYVEAVCQPGLSYAQKGGHAYFEIALDSVLHAEDTGVAVVPADEAGPVPVGEVMADIATMLCACLQEVYSVEVTVEELADAFYQTNRIRRLLAGRGRLTSGLLWLVEPLFGGRGAVTGHISPRQLATDLPDDWTDPFTGEARQGNAFALLREAQTRCEQMLSATLQYWMRVLPEAELAQKLGSMSYIEGRATERSALLAVSETPDPAAEPETQPDEKEITV